MRSMKLLVVLKLSGKPTFRPNGSGKHSKSDTSKANSYTEEICAEIIAQGIEVFTIAFDLNDKDTEDLLKDCATDDGYFYDADDAEELKETFVAIGRDLAELAISQ